MEPLECVHVGIQGTAAHPAIQGTAKLRLIPRGEVLAVTLGLRSGGVGRSAPLGTVHSFDCQNATKGWNFWSDDSFFRIPLLDSEPKPLRIGFVPRQSLVTGSSRPQGAWRSWHHLMAGSTTCCSAGATSSTDPKSAATWRYQQASQRSGRRAPTRRRNAEKITGGSGKPTCTSLSPILKFPSAATGQSQKSARTVPPAGVVSLQSRRA